MKDGWESMGKYFPISSCCSNELKQLITVTITAHDTDIFPQAWADMNYRLNVCHVRLKCTYKTFVTISREASKLSPKTSLEAP